MKILLSLTLFALTLPGPISANAQDSANSSLIATRTTQSPIVDGDLSDAAWQKSAFSLPFTRPTSVQAANKVTTARAAFDDKALYLAFTCTEPQPAQLKATAQTGGDVWRDDCIEIWLKGEGALDFDQFIVNSKGAQQTLRMRGGTPVKDAMQWQAAAKQNSKDWTVEVRLPFDQLGTESPQRGEMLPLKFGREDYTTTPQTLSIWPPRAQYGSGGDFGTLYLEDSNLLPNATMAEREGNLPRQWSFGNQSEYAPYFTPVQEANENIIRFVVPGQYVVAQQSLKLKPDAGYRVEVESKGTATTYIRARVYQPDGKTNIPYQVEMKPSAEYQRSTFTFPTTSSGQVLFILGAAGGEKGNVALKNLKVTRILSTTNSGPRIPVPVNATQPLRVVKRMATDSRAVRGFVVAPVDGKLDSFGWNGLRWEYNEDGGGGAGVGYFYRKNDGLHITLAGNSPIDTVQIRGGAKVKLYGNGATYAGPGKAPLLHSFEGASRTSRALFPQPVNSNRFSFFDLSDGTLSDISFFHLDNDIAPLGTPQKWTVGGVAEKTAIDDFLKTRFAENEQATFSLSQSADNNFQIPVTTEVPFHLVSSPLQSETALTAIGLDFTISNATAGAPFSVRVHDPLNPRGELFAADFSLNAAGHAHLVLDFPDQIIPAGTSLWLTLQFDWPAKLSGPAGSGAPQIELYTTKREQAIAQALAYRKLLLKGLFAELSEPRPWGHRRTGESIESWLAREPLAPQLRELVQTLDQCTALAPNDDEVRQYREWMFRREYPTEFTPRIDQVSGAPEWAVVARQAWLTARQVPQWWMENRLVPTGEFGGLVGDDTDMYQNFASFPMLERDGVAAEIMDGAHRLMQLANAENLKNGLNRRSMDPLHAYEEGINHMFLMHLWHYGDPYYFSQLQESARSSEALMVRTPNGHRHFKSQKVGAEDLTIDRKTDEDGDAHPLMLQPLMEMAWYNRNPRALKILREWGDTWLAHFKPGDYPTMIEVATEKATATDKRPLTGGYGTQAAAFVVLYWLTGDTKYLQPFYEGWQSGNPSTASNTHLADFARWQVLEPVKDKLDTIVGGRPAQTILTGDKKPLIDQLKRDIAELQRFPLMYTSAEPFTDRIFLYAIDTPALAYTGGYTTRNKLTHPYAVTYDGFGTDYAAWVVDSSSSHLKVLLYNFTSKPLTGNLTFWTLDHGRYRVTQGVDSNNDDKVDTTTSTRQHELQRAAQTPVTLPPRRVTVLEVQQETKLDDIFTRADLAISPEDTRIEKSTVTGVVYNIGAGSAAAEVALVDDKGKVISRQSLGTLAAPLELTSQSKPFRLTGLRPGARGWKVVVDAGDKVAEIYEGNNSVVLKP